MVGVSDSDTSWESGYEKTETHPHHPHAALTICVLLSKASVACKSCQLYLK